MPAAMYHNHCF